MSARKFHKWVISSEQIGGHMVGEASAKNSIGYTAKRSVMRMWLMIQNIKRGFYRKLPGILAIDCARDGPEEEEEEVDSHLVARARPGVSTQKPSELEEVDEGASTKVSKPEKVEAASSQTEVVEGGTRGEASRIGDNVPRDDLRVIHIPESPRFLDATIREAANLVGRSGMGPQGAIDIHNYLDGVEFKALGDVTWLGDLSALVLHHEAFLRIWEERKAEVRNFTEKSNTYKLLSENLQADLMTARDEHAEMAGQVFRVLHDSEDELEIITNDPILQVRQRLEQIKDLQRQIDSIRAEAEKFKGCMDILASQKEAVQAELESTDSRFGAEREKTLAQATKIDELLSRLDSAISDKANLSNELERAKSEVAKANTIADAKVAQFKVDVETIQVKARSMVDHAKWQARREALEEFQA
ncbi:uncharacterized protein [Nicotiana sylvestris]|uniref:uncharacterized protein n=1 Tax=Nicotiana sylvestris TaxID=4096 RepID=UPI00388C7E63